MARRLDLQTALEAIAGSAGHVYFQPPENLKMLYPAIVYNRDFQNTRFADNLPFHRTLRYQVTVIDPSPDSPLLDKIADMPMSTFVRHFTTDNLNHDVYDVYF
jgi:hypothetical protein